MSRFNASLVNASAFLTAPHSPNHRLIRHCLQMASERERAREWVTDDPTTPHFCISLVLQPPTPPPNPTFFFSLVASSCLILHQRRFCGLCSAPLLSPLISPSSLFFSSLLSPALTSFPIIMAPSDSVM
ncbi:hypothetical protein TcWFU_006299 [Taenia crassiceps]|uniref:Uncharacterized protein n=1 Tax=Taenia crassiceps TaxID=6207 RepID=A0ABR4Q0P4_9CEST